ncbi:MAG: hypothetical protein ACXVZX_08175 [Terriglobales bacterium]
MSVPMRKEEPEFEEEITTADLAQGKRPVSEDLPKQDLPREDRLKEDRLKEDRINDDRPRPVLAGRASSPSGEIAQPSVDAAAADIRNTASEVRNTANTGRTASDETPLFPNNELEELRNRWSGVQTAFVDEPRSAVEQADSLVAAAMKRLAEVFAEERSRLEQQWDRGDNVSTEDLRIALQRYRSFFQRLLSV